MTMIRRVSTEYRRKYEKREKRKGTFWPLSYNLKRTNLIARGYFKDKFENWLWKKKTAKRYLWEENFKKKANRRRTGLESRELSVISWSWCTWIGSTSCRGIFFATFRRLCYPTGGRNSVLSSLRIERRIQLWSSIDSLLSITFPAASILGFFSY